MSRGNRAKAGLATLAAASVVAAAAAVPAGATRTVNIPTSAAISAYGYFGQVKSSNPGCVGDRKVVLKQKGHGVLGRDTSDAQGHWKVNPEDLRFKGGPPFKIFAVVKPVSEGTAGTIYNCLGATSKTIEIKGG